MIRRTRTARPGPDDLPTDFDESAYLAANPDVAAAVAAGRIGSGADHWRANGRAEGRPLTPAASRESIARSMLDPSGCGIELGPLDRPIMAKRDGYRVEIVDYMSAEELRAHYGGRDENAVDVDAIEEVDHVSGGQSLTELVGRTGAYDWIVASHVIEHVPDPVSFFRDVEALLVPSGRLVLVIPDKRYCFDHFGELTSSGQVVDAFVERRTRPTPGQVVDYFARTATADGSIAWGRRTDVDPVPTYGADEMRDGYDRSLGGDSFGGEIHCWRFTPASFRLLVADLRAVGLIDLGIVEEHDTVGIEFFVALARVGPDVGGSDERRGLLTALASDPS